MRVRSLSATALAATAAIFLPHHSLAQDAEINSKIETQISVSPTTSAMTTYYLTRTVMRVVETETATMSKANTSSLSTSLRPSASVMATHYANGTTTLLGTNATPTSSSIETGVSEPTQSGTAYRVAMDSIGSAAVAGIVGLMLC
ncbi:hypothetical protein KC363_g5534 [Hortaea werneckii]|nr:hypothetical protein KC361_g1392 [Hortaea werneckii]KAI6888739.1 hypothetical protein KC325_g1142 [Hortaea werneckii]KAI7001594.1 hypothetical protein KC359_g480 [Hortaea werneckii]KAI7150033.1 hypothetical protein KC344_g466 [Hortaea werneckii]KAI7173939.1 hypothetical protein KC360_g4591 [Hortaea werneckii]